MAKIKVWVKRTIRSSEGELEIGLGASHSAKGSDQEIAEKRRALYLACKAQVDQFIALERVSSEAGGRSGEDAREAFGIANKGARESSSIADQGTLEPVRTADEDAREPLRIADEDGREPLRTADEDAREPLRIADEDAREPLRIADEDGREPLRIADEGGREPLRIADEDGREPLSIAETLASSLPGGNKAFEREGLPRVPPPEAQLREGQIDAPPEGESPRTTTDGSKPRAAGSDFTRPLVSLVSEDSLEEEPPDPFPPVSPERSRELLAELHRRLAQRGASKDKELHLGKSMDELLEDEIIGRMK